MPDDSPPGRFDPLDATWQPRVPIEGYPNTWRRNPRGTLFRRPLTRSELTGPMDLSPRLKPGDNDLARLRPGRVALGQLIHVEGRVLDEDGRPVRGAIVELWQANAAGRYFHPIDQRDAPLDPDFVGNGRTRTDDEGRYAFFTDQAGRLSRAGFRALVAAAAYPHVGAGSVEPVAPGHADVFPRRPAEPA